MWQAAQIGGALMVLVPFVLLQFHRTTERSFTYLLGNLVGSLVLTAVGLHEQQWGFVLLEATWRRCRLTQWPHVCACFRRPLHNALPLPPRAPGAILRPRPQRVSLMPAPRGRKGRRDDSLRYLRTRRHT